MLHKIPKGFTLLITILLLLVLAGYLWLADIVPKQSPSPLREEMQNTALAPVEDVRTWESYRDPKLGFTMRHPKSWSVATSDAGDYAVTFSDRGSGYALTVRAHANSTLTSMVNALSAASTKGLFPPLEIMKLALTDGSEAPVFVNYMSPQGDATLSSAAIERNGIVYVFELKRPLDVPDHEGLFSMWLRSFSL